MSLWIHQFNDLLELPADAVKEWLTSVWTGDEQAPEQFNWLGLADSIAFNATSSTKQGLDSADLDWACIAILIYQYLAKQSNIAGRDSYLNSALNLRVFMINRFGSIPGDPVLDLEQVLQWFLDGLPLTLEDTMRKSAHWQNLDHSEILELRRIKNRLSILEHLSKDSRLKLEQDIEVWLSIRERLP